MKYVFLICIFIFSINTGAFSARGYHFFVAGGGEDLVPIPWPMSQCPWNINNLYGQWTVKQTSKKSSRKKMLLETYEIAVSSLGASIVRTKANKTKDSGFVIVKSQNKQISYKAVMYSASGAMYVLSIYVPKMNRKKPYKKTPLCNKEQKVIKNIVFIRHKGQNIEPQDNTDQTESWLLEKQVQ